MKKKKKIYQQKVKLLENRILALKKINKIKNFNIKNNNNINKINNYNNSIQSKEEEEKLKLSNQVLKKSNQDLHNENRILEVEITNYQSQENSKKKIFLQIMTKICKILYPH